MSDLSSPVRHDWSLQQIREIHDLPLFELVDRARAVHLAFHKKEQVQLCTLLSVKTGGCPEDCAYCPQSSHHETPVKGDFTVTLKIPESSARFVKSLIKAAAAATKYSGKVGKEIRFVIPIEPDSPGQIQVNWESAPAKSSGKRGVAAKSTSASRKKR